MARQVEEFGGAERMAAIGETLTARCPLVYDEAFLTLAAHSGVLALCRELLGDYVILMQQNGVINPSGQSHTQLAYHRDLPYQHFVSSRPMAISALFCIDPFTTETGATTVIPGSHRMEMFPSDTVAAELDTAVSAEPGSFIVFDSMVFHRAGENRSGQPRRGVNQVFSTPIIAQQISLPDALDGKYAGDPVLARLLGYDVAPSPLGHRVARTPARPTAIRLRNGCGGQALLTHEDPVRPQAEEERRDLCRHHTRVDRSRAHGGACRTGAHRQSCGSVPRSARLPPVLAGPLSGPSLRPLVRRCLAPAQPARLPALPAARDAEREQAAGAQRAEAARGASHPGRQRVGRRGPARSARASDRASRFRVCPGRATTARRSSLRGVCQETGARRPAHLAAGALWLGSGRLRRRRPRARHSRRHAPLQLGQPEHEGLSASGAGLDVRVERTPAVGSARAARVP